MLRYAMLTAVLTAMAFIAGPTLANLGEKTAGTTAKSGTAKSVTAKTGTTTATAKAPGFGKTDSTAKTTSKSTEKATSKAFGKTEKSEKGTSKSTEKSTSKAFGNELLGEKTEKSTSKSTAKSTDKGTTKAAPIKIGDAMPMFMNLPNATKPGETVSAADMKQDVVVVCITCNHCPVAVMYEDRMIAFAKKYDVMSKTSKVGFVAINVNNGEQDRLPKMVERAKEKGFNFCYAYDESQKIGRDLNAVVTPEFYVFDKNRKLIFHGPLDDNNAQTSAKTNYLEQAVEAGLKGTLPETTEVKARGCGVQYQR